jgi:sarcosine oxidase subunit alpha
MTAPGPYRLPAGGLVERAQPLAFRFDERAMNGFAGDTLASALLANGERLVARSFKYHRPRGVFSAGSDEPNALVELRAGARREPNTKATSVALYEGLEAASQNRWPSLRFDLAAVNSYLGALIGAGFYYKTFMWPASFWERVYEPLIRRAAGLGSASGAPDPDRYEHANAFCEVLVVGGGPSGLAAALAAARAGARVIVCDEDVGFGGRLLADRREVSRMPGPAWVAKALEELASFPDVRVMPRTTVFGAYDGNVYAALESIADDAPQPAAHLPRQRLWRIVAERTVLAAGATERGIVFGGNDRPGVMLASAMRSYANRFGVGCGKQVTIFTNNAEGWATAADLVHAGVAVAAVIDSRPAGSAGQPEVLGDARFITSAEVVETSGHGALRAIKVRTPTNTETIATDALGVSGGFTPNLHLACHTGARPVWSDALAAFVPGEMPKGLRVAGAAAGAMTLAACLRDGYEAGALAAALLGYPAKTTEWPLADDEPFAITPLWHVAGSKQKAFVDLQNDVTVDDIALSAREGFRSVEHLKRYTTLGMATDQGKTGNLNGLAILATITGRSIPETGVTTFRPPYAPVAIGALAGPHRGKHYRPVRLTPSHAWAAEQGAVFVEVGPWLRAQYFPRAGESGWLESMTREVRTVRGAVGFCDVSTLGKIEVQGADAAAFLDRLYINTIATLKVGRARYGVMLREDGFVLDDGAVSRFADDRFFVTTTTANAARVLQHMEFCHQVLWPELDVQIVAATDQWAQFSVAGPRARAVLSALVDPPFDIGDAAFPHMAVAELTVCGGTPARLYRLSFSGELAYEIAAPAACGHALAAALMRAGEPHGIAPYGTEALAVLRIEKGHVAGNEIDGRTTAYDLGLARMMAAKDCIGRVLGARAALNEPERAVLVGLKPVEPQQRLQAGAHLVPLDAAASAANDQGFVSSVAFSPTLDHWIALGFLARGRERLGERVRTVDPVRDGEVVVEVCAPCFVDQTGEKLSPPDAAGDAGTAATARAGTLLREARRLDLGGVKVGASVRDDVSLAAIAVRIGKAAELARVMLNGFELALPREPGRAVGRDITVAWAGPGLWFAQAEGTQGYALEARLRAALARLASVTDQSDARIVLRLAGENARAVLAKGVAIDLDPRAFKPGDCAVTEVAHMHVHLSQIDAAPTYELQAPRSSAQSFVDWLAEASAEFSAA